jgi:hypothetical protein
VTLEHTFPRWTVPLIKTVGDVASSARVSHHEEHVHSVWGTETIDLKARKVCESCNTGWMSTLERDVGPILSPMITSTDPRTLTEEEALLLAMWVTKTALTCSLAYPETDHPTPPMYYDELYRERRPLSDSVVWIGGTASAVTRRATRRPTSRRTVSASPGMSDASCTT